MQRKQIKNVTKAQSKRAVPRKQSNNQKGSMRPRGTMQGPSRLYTEEMPSTVASITTEPTWLRFEGKTNHPELGGGVRIAGRQLLTNIATTAGDAQLFSANVGTVNTINTIFLSPDICNGRLALQARNYDRYIFRKARLTYVSRIPTSTVGSFAVGFVGDPVFPSPSFANITSMCPATQRTFYGAPSSIDIVDDMTSTKTFFTLYDATSAATLRQTVQGTIIGAPDVPNLGALVEGFLWIDYLIDLYQPTIDQGFSLRLTKEEEDSILSARKAIMPTPTSEISMLQARIQLLKTGGNANL
jgi:hypothetical protein